MPKSMSAAVPVPCSNISLLRKQASTHLTHRIFSLHLALSADAELSGNVNSSPQLTLQARQASDRCYGV